MNEIASEYILFFSIYIVYSQKATFHYYMESKYIKRLRDDRSRDVHLWENINTASYPL